ncbi:MULTISPECIES: acetyl-CoA carboxylase carboxyltransferase subunit alpha [Micromonospora]|uniref:acetyl-CoA carboxylase carboxyltransferase subunit alpha n=1 Tax=Micromonospora TaxID=1873 RepID=UPI001126FA72|nr:MULTISPECIES: acetyl-CoA carboxylase carboxyltransferase subunit alpha [unclassified Micromonospora]MBP1783770.1 acetyl-CoA carboxylase carboxyl transferase subunit beta [Micromonospora sp. HB375]MCK1808840.1 acetyl-CoA carboxylase carboxyltransferase subunit alpha [Micromonospora sp. R42106]MCK1834110.1 acetyl-CoA carboxylase carboxyltransferase subunit alpha [Micromonospora sp. R42003]MCK1846015.1 acetyl-CoA carboxylase carboxyltransferase subunit alpha [Micromonospora sp. R42004]MCM10192
MTTTAPRDEQLWSRCDGCASLLYRKRLRRNLDVCPECGSHARLDAPDRVAQLADPDSFTPLPDRAVRVDPIEFVDALPYPHRLGAARAATGLDEAVLCGTARVGGHPVALAVMDFRFLGGSLGCAVGELITRTAERALADDVPLVLVTASGGARMQEGALSLMQMATVSQALAGMREAGLLTVSVVTDPTYGGVAASFATNTDLVLAESGARLGFAGPRVIRQVTGATLPEGFQTAEYLLRHGQVDMVVPRHALRGRLAALLAAAHSGRRAPAGAPAPRPAPAVSTVAAAPDRDPWETVRTARHPGRPTTLDYLETAFDGFVELHGDRLGADCPAVVGGIARLDGRPVMVIGHQKGHTTAELVTRNFGMASPAGHRKALRLMRLAARLRLPVVTLVDTPGADPGVTAEQQGQAAAIAENILALTVLPTPVVAVVTGEGGSGGALALAVADRVLMLEHAVYSVISPEGCAAILWPDSSAAPQAARALRLTGTDLCHLGVVDELVPEPRPAAHADPAGAAELLRRAVAANLAPLLTVPPATLVRRRRQRFRRFGAARSATAGPAATARAAERPEVA